MSEPLSKEDRRLIEALRSYAKDGQRQPFPFDTLNYTLWTAADRIEQLARQDDAPSGEKP
ncbi:hypothetical protein EL18_02112 [Nitratireductor basaltis]|uniref:Uncharacterized protein n=1 Tax=Nitratireductor basaltis TaxID=472175 RepID=A0A084UDN4_9HYPH|nr:hypothetical protein EL18_02112 [Nitratireductor basaltis]